MIYKLSINNKNSAGTVHSKCSSTGSACPVASGHRVSIIMFLEPFGALFTLLKGQN